MRRTMSAAVAAAAVIAVAGCQSDSAAPTTSSVGATISSRPDPSPSTSSPISNSSTAPLPTSYDGALSHPETDSYYPQHGVAYLDTLHYGLALDWQAKKKRLSGTATITFRVTTARPNVRFALGAPLKVSQVVLDGTSVGASREGDSLVIKSGALKADSRHIAVITYAGTPALTQEPAQRSDVQLDGFHIGADGTTWTFQEPFGAFTWYPVNDQPADKAYYDAKLTGHDGQVGVFNGELTSTVKTGGNTTNSFRLANPAASYLTTVAFGKFKHQQVKGPRGLPINYWFLKSDSPSLRLARKAPQMLAWAEKIFGRYPFPSAGFLLVPGNSGMETQSLITFTQALSKPDLRQSEGDIVHELIHQWFGDAITPSDWKDVWLNESLTMYYEYRYLVDKGYTTTQQVYGPLQSSGDQLWRAMGGPPGAYHKNDFGDMNIYDCGALMLYNLEKAYGRSKLDAALKGWPATAKFGNSDRTKFAAYMSKELGRKAGPYITHWIMAKRTPAPLPKQ